MSGEMQSSAAVMQGCQADSLPCTAGSDVKYREDEKSAYCSTESPERELTGVNLYLEPDESVNRCVWLEKKWLLWHEFMKDHSCFIDWLQLAEKSVATPSSARVLYVTAKEELTRLQGLQVEMRSRLAQLDSLNEQHRGLTQHFRGVMARRLTSMAIDCSQRWDVLSKTVESTCLSLKHVVVQREEFENQCDDMAIWLSDMDLQLTEVEHFSGKDTCEKMLQLQSFQEAVGENVIRLNKLLERGEALIQHCEPADAQEIERSLQELLLYCVRVFEGVGRLHTRLLSMRLVFEEDCLLTIAPGQTDSCKALQEDEGIFEKSSVSEELEPNRSASLEHLVLEWDPSVDVGGSVSHDEADSDYFSSITGLHHRDEPVSGDTRRRSSTNPKDPRSHTAEMIVERSIGEAFPGVCVLAKASESGQNSQNITKLLHNIGEEPLCLATQKSFWVDRHTSEPVAFDPDRISAWLGQTLTYRSKTQERRPCSKGVQTECAVQHFGECEKRSRGPVGCVQQIHFSPHPSTEDSTTPSEPCQCSSRVHCVCRCGQDSDSKSQEEKPGSPDTSEDIGNIENGESQRLRRASHFAWVLKASTLLYVLLALLLGYWVSPHQPRWESGCHRSSTLARSFHLMLHYVNGPPPT